MRQTTGRAKALRQNQTLAEQRLWRRMRRRAIAGCRFYRQYPIGPFVADFCCRRKRLVVELDGAQHAEAKVYDDARTAYLQDQGFAVLRFWNNDVLLRLDQVVETIAQTLDRRCERRAPAA
jgi:very-short-patch-repair endonuclease